MDCKFKTELGLVTVNDEVLVRVAGYAALDCYGIVGMASKRSTDGIVQLMGRENLGRGVKVRQNGERWISTCISSLNTAFPSAPSPPRLSKPSNTRWST